MQKEGVFGSLKNSSNSKTKEDLFLKNFKNYICFPKKVLLKRNLLNQFSYQNFFLYCTHNFFEKVQKNFFSFLFLFYSTQKRSKKPPLDLFYNKKFVCSYQSAFFKRKRLNSKNEDKKFFEKSVFQTFPKIFNK